MKTFFATIVFAIAASSCSLTSNTIIKPKDNFILGNNPHRSFKVKLKNVSNQKLEIHQAPINGGSHTYITVLPHEKAAVKVDANTALVIANKSNDTTSVDLKVTGDLGLSMGYQK